MGDGGALVQQAAPTPSRLTPPKRRILSESPRFFPSFPQRLHLPRCGDVVACEVAVAGGDRRHLDLGCPAEVGERGAKHPPTVSGSKAHTGRPNKRHRSLSAHTASRRSPSPVTALFPARPSSLFDRLPSALTADQGRSAGEGRFPGRPLRRGPGSRAAAGSAPAGRLSAGSSLRGGGGQGKPVTPFG